MSSMLDTIPQPRLFDLSSEDTKAIDRACSDPRSAQAYEQICRQMGVEPRRP